MLTNEALVAEVQNLKAQSETVRNNVLRRANVVVGRAEHEEVHELYVLSVTYIVQGFVVGFEDGHYFIR